MKTILTSLVLLLGLTCQAQEINQHKFWDRTQKIDFATTFAVRAADAGLTCRTLANGGHEYTAPSQSCAGVTAWIMSGQVTTTLGQYWLHKHGHHKLERVLPWIAVSPNAFGVVYTFK